MRDKFRQGRVFHALMLVVSAFAIQACGKDTIADSVSRQKDRERATANAFLQESESLGGNYVGTATDRGNTYDIKAYLDTALINKDGTLVPQPSLAGSFSLLSRGKVQSDGSPRKIVFPFTNGAYDAKLAKLAVTISGTQGAPAILVNCQVQDAFRMKCLWHSLVSDLHFNFDLIKQ